MHHETKSRSIIKSISWRIISTVNGFLITWYFTDNISGSLVISLAANFSGLVLYYVHERCWNKIKFGIMS